MGGLKTVRGIRSSKGQPQDNSANHSIQNTTQSQPSLATRIAQSASSLGQSLLNPSASTANATLATASTGEKSRASTGTISESNTAPTWAESSAAGAAGSTTRERQTAGSSNSTSGFREATQGTDANANSQWQEFSGDATTHAGDYNSKFDAQPPSDLASDREMERLGEAYRETFHSLDYSGRAPTDRARIEEQDGADVVALLSTQPEGANAELEAEIMSKPRRDESEVTADDLFGSSAPRDPTARPQNLPYLTEPPLHSTPSATNPLNLRLDPTILLPDDGSSSFSLTVEQFDEWMNKWNGVLNGYTDEVWGNDIGRVREARQVIEEVQERQDGVAEDGRMKAVRRLGAILQHLEIPRNKND